MPEIMQDFFPKLEAGPPATFRNLSLWPLFYEAIPAPVYLTLEAALEQGVLEITEISEEGVVPQIRFRNQSKTPVLLLAGEEVVGAKQNRILNTSLLVPGEAEVKVPVSCVEQGRWSYKGREFTSERRVSSPTLRGKVQGRVYQALRSGLGYMADQTEVWEEVRRKASRLRVDSPTLAMSDIYTSYEEELREFCRHFPLVPEQKGFMAALQGRPVGLEAFDSHNNLARYYAKLLKGYALDAVEALHSRQRGNGPRLKGPEDFLQQLGSLPVSLRPSPGLGQDLRAENEAVVGAGLLWQDALVHFSLFPKEPEERSGRMMPPRRRARMI